MLNSTVVAALVFLAMAVGAAPSHDVLIDGEGRSASGRVPRPGSGEELECRIYTALGLRAAECYARDAAGSIARCSTVDGELLDSAATCRDASYLRFAWDERGHCTSIETTSGVPRARM